MPPQITFIKLDERTSIPIKIFIKSTKLKNEKSSEHSTGSSTDHQSLAINEKSLITLKNASNYQTKLSKNYLNTLINDTLSEDMKQILIHEPISELNIKGPKSNINRSVVVKDFEINSRNTRAIVEIPLVILLNVRVRFGRLTEQDVATIQLKGPVSDNAIRPDGSIGLLRKDTTVEEQVNILQEDEDEVIEEDTKKKSVGYKLRKMSLFSNLSVCIRVFLTNA